MGIVFYGKHYKVIGIWNLSCLLFILLIGNVLYDWYIRQHKGMRLEMHLRVLLVASNQLNHVRVFLKQRYYLFGKINISLTICEFIWNFLRLRWQVIMCVCVCVCVCACTLKLFLLVFLQFSILLECMIMLICLCLCR